MISEADKKGIMDVMGMLAEKNPAYASYIYKNIPLESYRALLSSDGIPLSLFPLEMMVMDGVCPGCLGEMPALTLERIREIKRVFWGDSTEELFDCCADCEKILLPGYKGEWEDRYQLIHRAHGNAYDYAAKNKGRKKHLRVVN